MTLDSRLPRGLTLIELLIVIVIITTLVSAAIPILTPTNDDRRLREASRIVNAFISGAQMKAIQLQRPYGVMIKRLSQDTNAEDDDDPWDSHDDNAMSVELLYVEQPSPFVGFDETSSVRVAIDQDPAAPPGQALVQFVRRGSTPNDDLPEGWDRDPLPPSTIRRGDIVEVGGTRHELIDDEESFMDELGFYLTNSGNPVGTYVTRPVNDTGQILPAVERDLNVGAFPERFWTHPMPFKILRQPMPASVPPLQLPDGTAIDLRASGVGTSDYFYIPEFPSASEFRDNREPIVIMFAPEGRVSRVRYLTNDPTASSPSESLELYDQPVVDNIYLLVARLEMSPPPAVDVDNTLSDSPPRAESDANREARESVNWLRDESRWIAIGSQSGRVVTTENAFVNLNSDSGGANTELRRNGQIQSARTFARQMSQLGGR